VKINLIKTIVIVAVMFSSEVYAEDWKEYRANHFIIYYKQAPIEFVKTIEKTAEDYYVDISKKSWIQAS